MKKILDNDLRNRLVEEPKIQELFSIDIINILELFYFGKDEFILRDGFKSEYLYILIEGKSIIYKYSDAGTSLLLGFCEPFDILGEAGTLWDKEATANVKSITDCLCLGLSLTKYREMLLSDNNFLRGICQVLSSKLHISNSVFGHIFVQRIENRLAFYILHTAIDNIWTTNLTECADMLNISYRHLIRLLKKLCMDNILKKQGKKFLIIDIDELTFLASCQD